MKYNVVASQRDKHLITNMDLDEFDPVDGVVLLYDEQGGLAGPFGLQSMLARGYWEDPAVETVDVDPEMVRALSKSAKA